jgi:hypothetical protein
MRQTKETPKMQARILGASALTIIISAVAAAGCGGGGGNSSGGSTTIGPITTVTGTLATNAFTAFLGSSSLADFAIPNQSALANRAFLLEDHGFVHTLDLSGTTPVSVQDMALDAAGIFPSGVAAASLTISDGQTAVVAANGNEAVYIFDPATAKSASDVTRIDLSAQAVTFATPPLNSVGQPVASPMTTTFTASGILLQQKKLFIASSNLDASFNLNPGTVFVYDYAATTGTASNPQVLFTSAFDPTRITLWTSAQGTQALLCVNAGIGTVGSGMGTVDVIDPVRAVIVATIPLAGASGPQGAVAITPDGTRGFIGSQSVSEVYELDLANLDREVSNATAVSEPARFTATLPVPGTAALNFISSLAVSASGRYLYTVNFNLSGLGALDISQGPGKAVLVDTVTGFQRSGTPASFVGNADFVAVRPGTPGLSFQGPAVYVGTINLAAADRTAGPNVSVALDTVSFDHN